MADNSKQSFPNIGGNGFIWILVAAATTYFVAHQIPLEGSRPATAGRSISEHVGEQHVDARLWQDPFAAVAEALIKSPELKPENCDRRYSGYKDIEMYCRPPSEGPGATPDLTLLVSVSGTPYSEDQEARRRKRYAVLAGLDAEGFVPEDPQHIGFYWPSVSSASSPASIAQSVAPPGGPLTVRLAGSPPPSTAVPLPKTVPFEWFKLRPERINDATTYRRILLLWFDEDVLAANASPAIAQSATVQDVTAQLATAGRNHAARVAAAPSSAATVRASCYVATFPNGPNNRFPIRPRSRSGFSARNCRRR